MFHLRTFAMDLICLQSSAFLLLSVFAIHARIQSAVKNMAMPGE